MNFLYGKIHVLQMHFFFKSQSFKNILKLLIYLFLPSNNPFFPLFFFHKLRYIIYTLYNIPIESNTWNHISNVGI